MLSIVVTLLGLTFLLGALNIISATSVAILWPILILVAGLMMLMKSMCKCCSCAGK